MGGKGTSQIPLWVLSVCQGDISFLLKGKIPQKSGRLKKKRKNIKPTTSFLFFPHICAIMSLRGGQMGTDCGQLRADRNSMPRKEPKAKRWHYRGTGNSYKRPSSELKVDVERMH